jgi:sulfur-oxidizing protein SoxX
MAKAEAPVSHPFPADWSQIAARCGFRDDARARGKVRIASAYAVVGLLLSAVTPASAQTLAPYTIEGDAIPQSLTGRPGDAASGRKIVTTRQVGLCLLCHSGPFTEERFQGDLSPSLAGAGSRWSEGQLRLRMVDGAKLNPDTIMPSYYRTDGLAQVAQQFRGKPILSAEQIEDVVAFLVTLRE